MKHKQTFDDYVRNLIKDHDMISIMSKELQAEIDREIIAEMVRQASYARKTEFSL